MSDQAVDGARGGARVKHDARGNAVWDWAEATGVVARRTPEELLDRLDGNAELELSGERPTPDWQGDPYNRPALVRARS